MLRYLITLLAAVALGGGSAYGADGTHGRLAKISGDVWVRTPGANEAKAVLGADLPSGSRLRTGKEGMAEVHFDDGSMLKLQPSSSILLSPAKRQQKKSSVLLFFGRLWNKVAPSKTGKTSYEVATANAVCGVRGTEFEASVGDDGSMRMQVTEGHVAVDGEGKEQLAGPGQQVEADDGGVGATAPNSDQGYDRWAKGKRQRLKQNGGQLVQSLKSKIMSRKDKLERLRSQQKQLEEQRKGAEARARMGEKGALDEIRKINQELATIADQIADIGDEAYAQFGLVDHVAELAADPRFAMVGRKTIAAEAASLQRVRSSLDKLVAEGTDISAEAMDKMLDDMSHGKGSLKEKKGSTTDELFDGDELDMH